MQNHLLFQSEADKDIIYEMCDVCGHDCDARYMFRSTFYSPDGMKYVIRHHQQCDATTYFNTLMKYQGFIK